MHKNRVEYTVQLQIVFYEERLGLAKSKKRALGWSQEALLNVDAIVNQKRYVDNHIYSRNQYDDRFQLEKGEDAILHHL